jgi:hypothetical protein
MTRSPHTHTRAADDAIGPRDALRYIADPHRASTKNASS